MPPAEEPLSRPDLVLLRRLVLDHKAAERRHTFPAVLHLGGPGGPEVARVVEGEADLDHALRCDLLAALLRHAARTRSPDLAAGRPLLTWLTRPGSLDVQDVDLAWMRVVAAVNDELDRALPYVVVTRDGWRDPWSGATRTWRRLRER